MPDVTLSVDDITDAFCRMLEPGIRKDALPAYNCNKYGVDVLSSKQDPYLLMFHFVTLENLEIELVMDLKELESRGREYMDHLYGLMCDQVEQARAVRAAEDDQKLYIPMHSKDLKIDKGAPGSSPVGMPEVPMKPSALAHNEAIN